MRGTSVESLRAAHAGGRPMTGAATPSFGLIPMYPRGLQTSTTTGMIIGRRR